MTKRKKYLILDCETATLPSADKIAHNAQEKQKLSISKPLIYDIGWIIMDRYGNIYDSQQYLFNEIFSSPSIFNTAYYREKRPLYINMLSRGEITLKPWAEITDNLIKSMENIAGVGAYNSMFDFKKAIPYTELYMNKMLSSDFYNWLDGQEKNMQYILNNSQSKNKKEFDPYNFIFRDVSYPLFDIWGLACKSLYNNKRFKTMCNDNNFVTNSKKYFSTTAETGYKFLTKNNNFVESHTALDDAKIESEILRKIFATKKKQCFENGIIYFPFKILGTVQEFTTTI